MYPLTTYYLPITSQPPPLPTLTSVGHVAGQTDSRALVWVRSDSYGVAALQLACERDVKNAIKTKTLHKEWRYAPPPVEQLTLTLADLADGDYRTHWYLPAPSR